MQSPTGRNQSTNEPGRRQRRRGQRTPFLCLAVLAITSSAFLASCTRAEIASVIGGQPSDITKAERKAISTAIKTHNAQAAFFNAILEQRAQRQLHPFLVCTRKHESGAGGYPYIQGYGYATGNGYYGAYQYLPSTWRSAAAGVGGHPEWAHVTANLAPWWVQDEVTLGYYHAVGNRPWGGRC
jgi:hypothetical protein